MTEKEWLAHENAETRRLVTEVFAQYDDGVLTLADAKHRIAIIVEGTMNRVYDHGFNTGLAEADLDGDTTEEIDLGVEFDEEEHP